MPDKMSWLKLRKRPPTLLIKRRKRLRRSPKKARTPLGKRTSRGRISDFTAKRLRAAGPLFRQSREWFADSKEAGALARPKVSHKRDHKRQHLPMPSSLLYSERWAGVFRANRVLSPPVHSTRTS